MNINYKRDLHFAQRRNLGQTTKKNMVHQLAINKDPPFRKCVFPMSLSKMESFQAEKRSMLFHYYTKAQQLKRAHQNQEVADTKFKSKLENLLVKPPVLTDLGGQDSLQLLHACTRHDLQEIHSIAKGEGRNNAKPFSSSLFGQP